MAGDVSRDELARQMMANWVADQEAGRTAGPPPPPMAIPGGPKPFAPLLGVEGENAQDNIAAGAVFGPPPAAPPPPKAPGLEYGEPLQRGQGGNAIVPVPPPGPAPPPPEAIGPPREAGDAPPHASGGGGAPSPVGGGGGGFSSGVIPGGMMPFTEKTTIKEGKRVPDAVKAAYGAASGLGLQAAGVQHDAERDLYQQEHAQQLTKIAAGEQAMRDHQRIAEERDLIARERLAEIESLNKQAHGKPEDLWGNGHIFARLMGTILQGIGFVTVATGGPVGAGVAASLTGGLINGLINDDIATKVNERKAAGAQSKRQTELLGLHLDRLKEEDKAVDALKLAYYDNVLQNMEAVKLKNAEHVNEAKFLQVQQLILEDRAKTVERIFTKEQADIEQESVQKMRAPTGIGGGVATKEPGNVVSLFGKSYAMPNEVLQNKAIEQIGEKQRLIRINNEIAQLRSETAKLGVTDYEARTINITRLKELEQNKLKAIETAEKQGVLREGEYDRAKATTGHATEGLGVVSGHIPIYSSAARAAADATIAAQTERWTTDLTRIPEAAGGKVIREGYMVDPRSGRLIPTADYTGQNTTPRAGMAPAGSQAMDPKKRLPTMPAQPADTAPQAPLMPYRAPAPTKKKTKT